MNKPCAHVLDDRFKKQTLRLKSTGYPSYLLVSLSDKMLKQLRKKPDVEPGEKETEHLKCAFMPYLHGIPHNLKKTEKTRQRKRCLLCSQQIKLMNRVNGKGKKEKQAGNAASRPVRELFRKHSIFHTLFVWQAVRRTVGSLLGLSAWE